MARILVVDDTKNIRKMVELTLKQSGHEVETAVDGQEGLDKFGDGSTWDLVLVDQQMPKMEGRELVREARKRDSSTRLVMMTAFATNELASEIMQAGALDFLRKPFTTEVLRGAVAAALSQTKIADDAISPQVPDAPSPKPGEAGFVLTRRSYRLNGFSFWSLPQLSTRSLPPNMEIGTTFQVRDPAGNLSECFVGVTQHIQQEVLRQLGEEASTDDRFWEALCGEALSEFFWNNAQTPPSVLPVFDVPKKSLRERHSLVSWGPFTHGR